MQREIKFRGKKKESGMWVYGDLNQNDAHNGISIREHGCIVHAVDYRSIGQYTGLKDKTGKEIYEWDMLETPEGIAFVVFENAQFAMESPGSGAIDFVFMSDFGQSKVIGNRWDNPELMKGKK